MNDTRVAPLLHARRSLLLAGAAARLLRRAALPAARPCNRRPAYKELEGWKVAQPDDAALHGNWWELFNDPQLNALEQQVNVSNQNIAAAFASFLQARAMVKEARAQYYPTLTASPTVTRSRPSANLHGSAVPAPAQPQEPRRYHGRRLDDRQRHLQRLFDLPFDASWTPDLWGRVRNTVKGNVAAAQASAADLREHPTDRAGGTRRRLLPAAQPRIRSRHCSMPTVVGLSAIADLTQRAVSRPASATDEAVAQARCSCRPRRPRPPTLGIARAQYEHAIALLVGQPASTFSIPVRAAQRRTAGDSGRRAIAVARATARRGGRRTAHGAGQCADRRGHGRLLSHADPERRGRIRELAGIELAHLAQPLLVGGARAGRDPVRRRIAARDGATVPGGLRSDRRHLPPDRADGVPAGRGQSGGAAHPFGPGRAAGCGRESLPAITSTSPPIATSWDSIRISTSSRRRLRC